MYAHAVSQLTNLSKLGLQKSLFVFLTAVLVTNGRCWGETRVRVIPNSNRIQIYSGKAKGG